VLPACPPACLIPACLQTRDEVRVLSRMAHPNIVLYHECFQEAGSQYIAMEFCEASGHTCMLCGGAAGYEVLYLVHGCADTLRGAIRSLTF